MMNFEIGIYGWLIIGVVSMLISIWNFIRYSRFTDTLFLILLGAICGPITTLAMISFYLNKD